MRNIETDMREIRPKGLTDNERAIMWSRIEAALPGRVASRAFLARKATGVLVALGLVGGSVATVYASNDALPGDVLFPVELAAEKVQIVLSSGKNRDTLRIKFAEERLDEVKHIVAMRANTETSLAASATASTSPQTGTSTTPASSTDQKIDRAFAVALAELERSRGLLTASDRAEAAFILDDIISELKAVRANPSATIRVNGNGSKVTIAIANSGTSTSAVASSTGSGKGKSQVKIESKNGKSELKIKDGSAKIEVKTDKGGTRTEIKIKNDRDDNDDKHGSGKGRDDDDDEDEDEDDDKHGKGTRKVQVCHVAGDSRSTITIALPAARAHLAHGDTLGTCTTTTPPPSADTTAPIVSALSVSAISTSSATISWTTNENADGRIWYATALPLATAGTPNAAVSTLGTSHTFPLAGLAPNTTYHFVITSADAAGNRATSTTASFTTLPLPIAADVTAPTLSALSVTNVGTSSATITWTTNESADGRVWFGTVSPVDTARTADRSETAISTGHSFSLSGLAPSTTYQYVVSSADIAGNRATSTAGTFTTAALPPPADVTAPSFNTFEALNITGSGAKLKIETNEAASVVVKYGLSPLNLASSTTVSNATFSLSHEFTLTGLATTTTYAATATVTDAAGNSHTAPTIVWITLGL
ncbi:MAG TPA: fibronectin type III domain-containing protein [Candidatus Paceibacterota bacterium]|nr:fibronectin type III domain-containing protein [Candidatus Paceibacterota bacterium]